MLKLSLESEILHSVLKLTKSNAIKLQAYREAGSGTSGTFVRSYIDCHDIIIFIYIYFNVFTYRVGCNYPDLDHLHQPRSHDLRLGAKSQLDIRCIPLALFARPKFT